MDEIAKEYDVVVLGTGKYPACGLEAVFVAALTALSAIVGC
jgi:uncharacterized protein (UPF0212 family)